MTDEKHTDRLTGAASLRAGTYIPGDGLQTTPSQKAAAGPQPDPKIVQMDVLRDGSFNGEYYHTGETADVPEEHVEALTLSGFAARSDRAELAQHARDEKAKDRAADDAAANKKASARSTAVKPLATTDVPGAEPPAKE